MNLRHEINSVYGRELRLHVGVHNNQILTGPTARPNKWWLWYTDAAIYPYGKNGFLFGYGDVDQPMLERIKDVLAPNEVFKAFDEKVDLERLNPREVMTTNTAPYCMVTENNIYFQKTILEDLTLNPF